MPALNRSHDLVHRPDCRQVKCPTCHEPYVSRGRRLVIGSVAFAGLMLLASCGGGSDTAIPVPDTALSPSPPAPTPLAPPPNPESGPEAIGVFPGFGGDLGWQVTGLGGDGGAGGGIGAGADGDGGVGAGGSLGQFRNALVYATLEDGTRLGPATTDPVTGLVTIKPGRGYAGALLVELMGQAGSEYYDEAKRDWVGYPAGQVLRAHVNAIRSNIGLTPLSDAAVTLAQADPQLAQLPLARRANESNERIRVQVNALLPGAYALDSVVGLPILLNPSSGKGSLPDTPAGRYGTVIAAFTVAASQFNPPLPAPGLSVATQLALDLADGTFNGARAGGAPLAPADQLAYDVMELPGQMAAAIELVKSRWGVASGSVTLPETVSYGTFLTFSGEVQGQARLLSDGRVLTSVNGGPETPLPVDPTLPSTALRATALFSDAAALMVRRSDGSVQGLGTNAFTVADAYRFGVATPAETQTLVPVASRLSGPKGATGIAFGSAHAVARTADGAALAWGANESLQLGIANVETVIAPATVIANGVRAVAASGSYSLAQLADGRVFSWGSDRSGAMGRGANSVFRQEPGAVQRIGGGDLTGIVSIRALGSTAIALHADGSVWGWGSGFSVPFAVARPLRYVAEPVNGLKSIRKVVLEQNSLFALSTTGVVYRWRLNSSAGGELPAAIADLPPIRDIQYAGFGFVLALGFDDKTFEIGFSNDAVLAFKR